ncbi:hypothetical protein AMTR_s00056p00216230 [Amborella trichopoda]|uniref:DNA replication ATP-dependent helicase/nuclease n=1 Tax=Amborella trichopoda TaxID=13333 RepID=U5CZ54_AMBTC|nr:hypothetical protein AMTR_s00056p00216230 [Amborella trichopoda]
MPIVDFGSSDGQREIGISEVIDIEEMAWSPKYGLKGVIDASIRIKLLSNTHGSEDCIVPLEFKTGKGTTGQVGMEHRAQVILYALLMSDRYMQNMGSGLLYYLHTDQTQGIVVTRSELIGLIMRRNELASDVLKAATSQLLPPMLRSMNMCQSCRHLRVCSIYHKAHGGNMESSGLGDLFNANVGQLTEVQCNFLRQWDRLIDLEAKESQVVRSEIWRMDSCSRERSGGCISSLILDVSNGISPSEASSDGQFIYRFIRRDFSLYRSEMDKKDNLDSTSTMSLASVLNSALKCGDHVILSTESGRLAIASGLIYDIGPFYVSVSLSRRLRLPGSKSSSNNAEIFQEIWRIDKDETSFSCTLMRSNLMQLFLPNSQSSHLRNMIVDLKEPIFDRGIIDSQDPVMSYIRNEKNLNYDQRCALYKILAARDYALILGMPGTGKTSTIVHAVKALLMRGSSILLTSYTNSAVDNLLVKLKTQGIDFIRLGRDAAIHDEIKQYSVAAMNIRSVEDMKLKMDQARVVGVTCSGITHPLLANKKFDVCIMDEAGQITLPVSLGPLMLASTFVLVGDHYQLPPLVQNIEARENGMGVSLFCRLSEMHPQAISTLQRQYRMCADIVVLANALIYGHRLQCGSSEVANAKLMVSTSISVKSWIKEALDPNRPVIFINTDSLPAPEAKQNKSMNNPSEAQIVSEITRELLVGGVDGNEIGIIAPYNSQVDLIRHIIDVTSVEIHTIDKYQGRDKDCIVVSFVRSNENWFGRFSLLGDWHRINVAITRAKCLEHAKCAAHLLVKL